MKKLLIVFFLLISVTAYAGEKLTGITGTSVHTGDDILYIVDDPGGTPASRYIARSDLFLNITSNSVIAAAIATDTYTFPGADGNADEVLVTDGAGALTFQAQSGTGGGAAFSYWEMGGTVVSPVTADTVSGTTIYGGNIYSDNNLVGSHVTGDTVYGTIVHGLNVSSANVVYTAYLYDNFDAGAMDMTGDPWSLSGAGLELTEDLVVGTDINAGSLTANGITATSVTITTVSASSVIVGNLYSDNYVGGSCITGVVVTADTITVGGSYTFPLGSAPDNYVIKSDGGTLVWEADADSGAAGAKENFSYWHMIDDHVFPVTATTVSATTALFGYSYADNGGFGGLVTAATVQATGSGQSTFAEGLVVNDDGGAATTDYFRVETAGEANALVVNTVNERIETNVLVSGTNVFASIFNADTVGASYVSGTTVSGDTITVGESYTFPRGSAPDNYIIKSDSGVLGWEADGGGGGGNKVIGFVFNGSSGIVTGSIAWVRSPSDVTLTSWEITSLNADSSGQIMIDIWKDTYANYPPADDDGIAGTIAEGEIPTLTNANKAQDTSLDSWTTAVSAGDYLKAVVVSSDQVTSCSVFLQGS